MGGLLPTPSGGGNPLALAGNILASLGNPSAANQLASSLLMQGGNQMGFNQGGGSYGGGYGGGQGQMRSYDDRDRVSQTETAPLFYQQVQCRQCCDSFPHFKCEFSCKTFSNITSAHQFSSNTLGKSFIISRAQLRVTQRILS